MAKTVDRQTRSDATIRFVGDSGDGMQLVGGELANISAFVGNDIGTFPDFPAEIRAPAGSLPGVSGYQLQFSSRDIHTPGDECDAIVAMNPAALKTNIRFLKPNGILIVNTGAFKDRNLQLAKYTTNPLEDHSLDKFQVFAVDILELTRRGLEELKLPAATANRCKNFFALGMILWLYNRPLEYTLGIIRKKFGKNPQMADANVLALKAGYAYCDASEHFATSFEVKPAVLPRGKYRTINGNRGVVLGLIAASKKSGLPLFLGSYPITPASDILHDLSSHKDFGVKTFQAEDEIAAICSAIGASYAGALAVTTTSGPGMALKTEAMGLAISAELPLVICDIQRAGPSTGMPTKNEQADLLQAVYGRNSEAPLPVLAASTPSDCFATVYEACRIALKYMTPVIFLSDGYLGNSAEPWKIPDVDQLPPIPVRFETNPDEFAPYKRNEETLARPWALPGTPGLEHRIGGLEKEHLSGNVSYDPKNHESMVRNRAEKVQRISRDIPPTVVYGDYDGDVLVLGWGCTFGAIRTAIEEAQHDKKSVSHVHLRYLNPLPDDLGSIMSRFRAVLIPELNLGQLQKIIQARYLIKTFGLHKVQGVPLQAKEIVQKIDEILTALK